MMGNLGDAVSALLDTYTKCLSLLKRLDRPSQQLPDNNDDRSVSVSTVKDAPPSGLAAALRKARTKVSRSYSSGVARRGSAFEKGDATSKKSLNRVLARLTATMAGLGAWFSRSGGGGEGTGLQAADGALSYASLVSLCNSSHTDAVRAMTDLSSRIGSRAGSRASVHGGGGSGSSSVVIAANASAAPTRSSKSSHSKRSGTGKKHRSSGAAARPRRGKGHREDKQASAAADRGSKPKTKTKTKESGDKKSQERDRSSSSSSRSKRASRLTMSSASTKLGEVRRHGRRDQQSGVAYPRHSLEFGSDGSLYGGGQKGKKRWWQF